MQQEPAHELGRLQRHGLVTRPSPGAVILPAERDAALVHGDEALVGNRHPVRIARQIRQYRRRLGERALSIDHPLALAQRRAPVGEGCRIGQRGVFAEELQLAAVMGLGKLLKEAPAEQPREHAHGQEEAPPAGDPTFSV